MPPLVWLAVIVIGYLVLSGSSPPTAPGAVKTPNPSDNSAGNTGTTAPTGSSSGATPPGVAGSNPFAGGQGALGVITGFDKSSVLNATPNLSGATWMSSTGNR